AIFRSDGLVVRETNRSLRSQADFIVLMICERAVRERPEGSGNTLPFANCPHKTLTVASDNRMLLEMYAPVFEAPLSLSAQRFVKPLLLHGQNRLQFLARGGESRLRLLHFVGVIGLVRIRQR